MAMIGYLRGQHRGERGSLPLALLVVIIVGGLVVVLVARTIATQSQVRFDQGFHASLPTADAGVNLGKALLNQGDDTKLVAADDGDPLTECDGAEDEDSKYTPRDFPVGCTTPPYEGEIDDNAYSFTLTRISVDEWEVDSTGEDAASEVERRVIATIAELPLINIALFADALINFGGANSADSYDSATGEWCTGSGFIATNGYLDLSGTSGGPCHANPDRNRTIDQALLHNWADLPGQNTSEEEPGGDRCVHDGGGGGANCRDESTEGPPQKHYPAPDIFDEPLEMTLKENVAFITHALALCDAVEEDDEGRELGGTFRTSENLDDNDVAYLEPGGISAAKAEEEGTEPFEFPGELDGKFYCYDDLYFDQDTRIDVDLKVGVDEEGDDPVIIVVRNEVIIEGGGAKSATHVGCFDDDGSRCSFDDPLAGDVSSPEAARLWIFTDGVIDLGGHSAFSGVLWGPQAQCHAGQQGHVFGSLVCGDIPHGLGNWKFHYDEQLAEVSSGEFYTAAWREEPRD